MPQPVATLRVAESQSRYEIAIPDDGTSRTKRRHPSAAPNMVSRSCGCLRRRRPASICAGKRRNSWGLFFSDEEAEVEEDEDGRRRRSLQPYATLSSTSSVSAMTTPRHQPTIFMAYCRAVIQIVSARPSVMPGMPLSGRGQVSGMVSRGGGADLPSWSTFSMQISRPTRMLWGPLTKPPGRSKKSWPTARREPRLGGGTTASASPPRRLLCSRSQLSIPGRRRRQMAT